MKPCAQNRKPIAWLALNELDGQPAQSLRAHLENCPGCRGYFQELSGVSRKLAAAQITPEVTATGAFHRRLVQTLKAEAARSPWAVLASYFVPPGWRLVPPVKAALVLAVPVALIWMSGLLLQHEALPPGQPIPALVSSAKLQDEPPSTLSNYRMIANQSLDALDDVITRQADQSASSAPTLAVSSLARLSALD